MPRDICVRPWEYPAERSRSAGNLQHVGNKEVSSHLVSTGQAMILVYTACPQTTNLPLE